MTRKTPVKHFVKTYERNGRKVRSYVRGNGTKAGKRSKVISRYMLPRVEAEYISAIGDIQDDPKFQKYALVTDSQDVEAIWDYLGNDPVAKDFNGFFVREKDGDYDDILGFVGSVPGNHKALYRLVKK